MPLAAQARAAAQEASVAEVASLLGVPTGTASLLLRSARWNQEDLLTRYMEDPEKVRAMRGCARDRARARRGSHPPLSRRPGAHTPRL